MSADRDRLILAFHPFQGDETSVRLLQDRMVISRAEHRCVICGDVIPATARIRARTERNNEEKKVMTFYFCELCCDAMGASWSDNGDAITRRTSMGMRLAGATRGTT